MFERILKAIVVCLGVLLSLFVIAEVNFPRMQQQSELAVFVALGLTLCFLTYPLAERFRDNRWLRALDVLLAAAALFCCGYVVVQTEPFFKDWLWATNQSLASRAGAETQLDFAVAVVGTALVLEATRRSIGWIVPLLAAAFIAHSYYCYGSQQYGWPQMPAWMLPHVGQSLQDIAGTVFLQTLGVFGPAARVMFKYVYLFVVFGAFLEISGATQFIIDFSEKLFCRSPGGPAKVAVLGSGLMGSLSGSAVANAVTTGTFTIPMMRRAGFPAEVAGGITAAAASGGALVPPVMGAAAYMMLELVRPEVKFLQVAKAALIPAVLYYLSLYYIVHFYSRRVGVATRGEAASAAVRIRAADAVVFFGSLAVLVGLLVFQFTPFRAVTGALVFILLATAVRNDRQLSTLGRAGGLAVFVLFTLAHRWWAGATEAEGLRPLVEDWLQSLIVGILAMLLFGLLERSWRPQVADAFEKSARNGVSLVAASACVGIIIGIVQQTGIAQDFGAIIKGLVEGYLWLALVGIMVLSIILGMGVPSVVCYLLMATLMGNLLEELGVIPLAAHLFIFYFGMMSMVTPPVALAAYASASIAEAPIMATAWAAFRFSLVGFTLPYMFVYRPELLLMGATQDDPAPWKLVAVSTAIAVIGIVSLAAGLAGYFRRPLTVWERLLAFAAAGALLFPGYANLIEGLRVTASDVVGALLFLALVATQYVFEPRSKAGAAPATVSNER